VAQRVHDPRRHGAEGDDAMTTLPLWLATVLYLWQSAAFVGTGQFGLAVAFLCYAGANLGFIWAAR
jgi:hypothetical protein